MSYFSAKAHGTRQLIGLECYMRKLLQCFVCYFCFTLFQNIFICVAIDGSLFGNISKKVNQGVNLVSLTFHATITNWFAAVWDYVFEGLSPKRIRTLGFEEQQT